LQQLVIAAWSLPLVALLAAGVGWSRARSRARAAIGGPLPQRMIVQVTTTGAPGAAEQVLTRLRELPSPVPLEIWVVVDEGTRTRFAGADRVVVVPADFSCRAQAKGRALEWARLERFREEIDGADVKVLLLDDDSVPTSSYLLMALEADADIAQGMIAPRNHYGRPLSHFDDLRPIHCLAICSWAQASGHPVHVHGEGLCVRASAEHAVGWDNEGAALAEDLVFGQRAAAAGLSWAFLPATVEITSPWSSRAFVTQRRRWSWGTVQALPHLPRAAALRILAFYVITLGAFVLSIYGTIDALASGREIAGPWPVALAAWLGLFGLAGWIGSRGRPSQALLAIVLAWPSAIVNALIVPVALLLGPPRRFRTILKLQPARSRRLEPLLQAARVPVIAAAAALLLFPAGASMATTLSQADSGPTSWSTVSGRPVDRVTDGVLRARDGSDAPTGPVAARPDLRRAITVLIYGNDPFFRAKTDRLLNRISALGVSGVSMTVPVFTAGLSANEVHNDPELTPSRQRILAFARAAHLRGMTVTLSPLLDERVLAEQGGWRGKLTPRDPSAWFSSYARLLSRYATLAEQGGFEGLNVGTEFESLELDPRWRRVLQAVRDRYDGTVSYAMAGSRVLDPRLPFLLHNVDFIGINAWYQLALPDHAERAEISSALAPWVREVNRFKAELGKPVVITEAGSRSRAGAYRHQVRDAPDKPLDLATQARVYEAICGFGRRIGAEGIIWWATTPDPPANPRADRGFDPLGKPAERQIRECGPPNPR
jgi:hypothetical protein